VGATAITVINICEVIYEIFHILNCDDHSLLELLIYILTLVPFHFHLSKGSVVLLPNYESFSTSKTVSSKWKSLLNYQKHIFYKKLN